MSRMLAVIAAMIAMTGPAAAQSDEITAEDAIEQARQMTGAGQADCPRDGFSNEIVVCARQRRSERLPLREERGARDGARRATGEVAAASAKPMRSHSCGARDGEGCGGTIPILPMMMKAAELAGKIAGELTDPDN